MNFAYLSSSHQHLSGMGTSGMDKPLRHAVQPLFAAFDSWQPRSWLCLSLALCGILLSTSAAANAHYRVRVSPGLEELNIGACFDDGVPASLAADNTLQRHLRGSFYSDGKEIRPRFRGERLLLPSGTRCFRYRVELNLNDTSRGWDRSYRVGRDVVTKPQHWLIQPRQPRADDTIELSFELPPGIAVSAPWPERHISMRDGRETLYQLAVTPPDWDTQVAFGHFTIEHVPVGDTFLRLAILDSYPPVNVEETKRWVREAASATLSVHGHFPQPAPQTLIVPVGRRSEAVPFARVLRGGSVALQFFVDPTRPFREFSTDWTATHEFSHLLLPYVSRRDAWLSEGLASYMQNVLRVRDGRISERQAWSKLYAGFQRGQRATARERSPRYEARSRSGWSTMRIYWGGAAIWFLADVELRRRSDGAQTVDRALAGLHDCCMAPGRLWRARDLMRELDRITGDTVFGELYDAYAHSDEFPRIEETLQQLGVDTGRSRVRLNDQAQETELRRQIMFGS